MSKSYQYVIYVIIGLFGLIAAYTILTAGSPDSLNRKIFSDPRADVYVAIAASFAVFVLGFLYFFFQDREGFRQLIELNADKIRSLREQGVSDPEIAGEILRAMGSISGYRHNMARKKLILYLSEFK